MLGIDDTHEYSYKLVDEQGAEKVKMEEVAKRLGSSGSDDDLPISMKKQCDNATVYHIPAEHIVNGVQTERHCINIINAPRLYDK